MNISESFDDEDVVLYLEGIALQNDGLSVIKHPRALLRKDHTSLTSKVKILSGGQAGRVPLHAGFVGQGMLTAAVFGDEVNSSPSFLGVVKILQVLAKKHTPGILIIAMNSLTERLIYSLACQQVALEGIKTMSMFVGEDCSGMEVTRAIGRRGLCGILFLQKIAGAMAEDNKTLFEIHYVLTYLNGGSLGSINTCITDDYFSFSSKLKNKNGTVDINSISRIVKESLCYILQPLAPYSLHVCKEEQVAIIVNNFGTIPDFHMTIITREICNHVMAFGIELVRVYSGRFMTSSADDFSVSILKVNERLLKWLDFSVNVTSWPNHVDNVLTIPASPSEKCLSIIESTSTIKLPQRSSQHSIVDKRNLGPKFLLEEAKQIVNIINKIINIVSDLEEHLNELDTNNDFGSNVMKFMTIVRKEMDQKSLTITTPYGLLNHLAKLAATSMGGASGAIFSVLFISAAQSFVASSSRTPVCWCMWMDAATLARDALCAYTKVELGDYVIFDALHAFIQSFETPTEESLSTAVQAALREVDKMAQNQPEGFQDPGAFLLANILPTILQELQKYLREE